MQKLDSSNTIFTLSSDLVNYTSRDVFLTGKAGSGKTTFLRYIKESCPKKLAIVAPTGVAAINAGGVTIHSFFQLPLAPFIPQTKGFVSRGDDVSDRHSLLARMRLNSERRRVLQELELLVIDEISMVRCDVLDAIDVVLRHVRHRPSERFGGVQLLLVGDLFQLPPVVRDQEWQLLRSYYESPFFFDSCVMREAPPVCVEFTRIYRQTDERFIRLLNMVRNNEVDDVYSQMLHERYRPEFFGDASAGYILLTTHNEKARQINSSELGKLPGKTFTCKAGIDGEFPPTAFPADETLQLKVGAQVMFIRNDVDKARRFFNGKIGVVTGFDEDNILVQCNDGSPVVEVSKESWKNIRYTLDKKTRKLNEDVLGSFKQYPLRLAWAITIHKSQGLTFERAVIDAGNAFAPGQVYVALSRCTSLDGMVLHSRIHNSSLSADERVVRFTKNMLSADALQQELNIGRKAYQEKCIASLFDFGKQAGAFVELKKLVLEHGRSFNDEVTDWLKTVLNQVAALQSTGEKFQREIRNMFAKANVRDHNEFLIKRFRAASEWFCAQITKAIETILKTPARTDSSLHAKVFNAHLKEAFIQYSFQSFMLSGLVDDLDMTVFLQRKKAFVVPAFGVNAYAGLSKLEVAVGHPDLYYQLKELRDEICTRRDLPIYIVAGSRSLEEMATYLPQSVEDLQKISGFGKAKAERFGPDFLSIINRYCQKNSLSSAVPEKKAKRSVGERNGGRPDTKEETYRRFRDGKSPVQIAKERNLAPSTIESHLAHFVRSGRVNIGELIPEDKLSLLRPVLEKFSGGSIVPLKQKLGEQFSFGEIRWALAALDSQNSPSHVNH